MNFFKRAWLNLVAKKGRTVLLILVTSAIMLFVLAGLLIRNAADAATSNAKKSIGATLTLSANREAAFKKMRQGTASSTKTKPSLSMTPVKLADVKKIAKLNNVASYNLTSTTSVNAKSFDAISTSSTSSQSVMQGGGDAPGGDKMTSSQGDIAVSGVSATSLTSNFTDNNYKITKGRGIKASDANTNNIIIETELAKQESLKVGDTVTVKATSGSKTYKLTIVGIYKAPSTSTSSQMGPGATDPSNTIYSSYTLANTIKGTKYANTADSVTFTVSDPAKVSSVKKAGKKLINTSKYSLSANDASYQSVKASMNNVKSFADKIVWLVAIAGTIILALIVILMIRERRYEIGVLLSMGESRMKIIGQFFVEMFIVLVIAVGVAGIGGKFVGNKLGEQLVAQETSSTASNVNSQRPGSTGGQAGPGGSAPSGQAGRSGGASFMGSSKTDKTELDVQVTPTNLAELGGFGLAIIFISITLASGGILRLSPRKVLID
ncbi:ABC transporter permease [Lapidilactobacillus bayanensis]|uniref:ABC transporter permease n=1 Tax=Lapidilactobacillus bayanensis TaxID=2485998 RepID=UPI000F7A7069|nr:ABC transporter permease [Lapidilactobacillus bayanensis]